ncbi:methyl-accepting chemotaxis protein [Pokkaliibacter plantistimulans]|nr:methyl-accepting chemotaxis protein [Pokkaliibacter plantistimulans]
MRLFSIQGRLWLGFSTLIVATLILGGLSTWNLQLIDSNLNQNLHFDQINSDMQAIRTSERTYLKQPDDEGKQGIASQIDALRQELSRSNTADSSQNGRLQQLTEQVDQYSQALDSITTAMQSLEQTQQTMLTAAEKVREAGLDLIVELEMQYQDMQSENSDASAMQKILGQIDETNNLIQLIYQARIGEKNFLLGQGDEAKTVVSSSGALLDETSAKLALELGDEESRKIAQTINQNSKTYIQTFEQLAEAYGKRDAAGNTLHDAASTLQDDLLSLKQEQQQQTTTVIDTTRTTTLILVVLLVVVGVLLSQGIARSIVAPLNATSAMLEDIARGEGDLRKRLPVAGKDELTRLASAFNQFVDKLQVSISRLAHIAHSMGGASSQLASTAQGSHQQIQQQQQETEQVATAIEEMAQTVHGVARHAEQASQLSVEADLAAAQGSTDIRNMQQALQHLSGNIRSTATSVEDLKRQSQGIGSIVDVIRTISEQTNLLALNAAIEAARAGEQGRGFAVVADEVRALAQRTQTSTNEIQQVIANLQQGSDATSQVMEQSLTRLEHTMSGADKAVQQLEVISHNMARMAEMNTLIASAAEEQAAVAQEITGSIHTLAELAEQSNSDAHSVAQASQAVMEQASSVNTEVGQFRYS